MLDYRAIEALQSVLSTQSFEKAALELHITQSAVSQRIKSLEFFYGEPVLIRILPYRATELGSRLIRLLAQVQLLEKSFGHEQALEADKPKLSIAINRDSLETWFLDSINQCLNISDILLNILADDQELTLDYFRRGLVCACLSTTNKTLTGAQAIYLGTMNYILVASPSFLKKYFFKQDYKKFFNEAPALKFDQNDHLHESYLKRYFPGEYNIPYQIVPSVAGFKKYALLGYGYGLIPNIDIEKEIYNRELVNLFSDKIWEVPLYWHMWSINSAFYQKFNSQIISCAQQRLK